MEAKPAWRYAGKLRDAIHWYSSTPSKLYFHRRMKEQSPKFCCTSQFFINPHHAQYGNWNCLKELEIMSTSIGLMEKNFAHIYTSAIS